MHLPQKNCHLLLLLVNLPVGYQESFLNRLPLTISPTQLSIHSQQAAMCTGTTRSLVLCVILTLNVGVPQRFPRYWRKKRVDKSLSQKEKTLFLRTKLSCKIINQVYHSSSCRRRDKQASTPFCVVSNSFA